MMYDSLQFHQFILTLVLFQENSALQILLLLCQIDQPEIFVLFDSLLGLLYDVLYVFARAIFEFAHLSFDL
jgi:hypothetical protein